MSANLSAMTWWQYVTSIAGGDTQTQISQKSGVTQSNVSRWRREKQGVDPTSVAAVARAYGRPVLEAFIAAGFLSEDEARAQVTITRYEQPDDETLLDLLAARLRRDGEAGEGSGQQPAPMKQAGLGPAHQQHDHQMSEGDYTLAARDADDDAESEAQQIDP